MYYSKKYLSVLALLIISYTSYSQNNPSPFIGTNYTRGDELLILRLAVACPGEFTQQVGGITEASRFVDSMVALVNIMYGREFSVRFELISNNDLLISADPSTDPWPDKAPGGGCNGTDNWEGGVQKSIIDGIVGAANYDISHIFYSDALAGGCAGSYDFGASSPSFNVIRHEMGHQFQQSHTINNGGGNNYEPENAGRSMMGGNSDAVAHSLSFHQLVNHLLFVENGVGTTINTGNSIPTADAGPDRTIPIGTAFTLTGMSTDSDQGDLITYAWDQLD